MGLCKCRTVTPLFCFDHRKNVCEKCVLTDHPTCVVRTYLQWLQDSEFDPNCALCHAPLADGRPTIRLPCFDLFHWECLERDIEGGKPEVNDDLLPTPATASVMTLNRAKCPLCRMPLIPPAGDSPLLEQMRVLLSPTKWSTQLPPPPPPMDKLHSAQEHQPSIVNGVQPNEETSPSMITIEMGVRPSFALPARRQPDEPKVHAPPLRAAAGTGRRPTMAFFSGESAAWKRGSLKGSLRILLNCLTLRNLRLCSFGISPRQSLVFFLLVALVVLGSVHWILPLLRTAV